MSLANKQFSVIQIRRGLESEFVSSNIVLASGEPAYTTDTNILKIGNGVTPWNNLLSPALSGSYFILASGNSFYATSGNFGDLRINGSGVPTLGYVNNLLSANDAMLFKGTLGVGGTVTALPTNYETGWTYKVITAGTYAGNVCEIGDLIIAIVDRLSGGGINSDWVVAQTNIDNAVSTIGGTSNYITKFTNTTAIGNSLIYDDGTNVGINTTSPIYTFDVNGSGNFASGLYVNNIPVSISGHTHASSDISDFNSTVSGLLPVKHIVSGTDINVTNVDGIYTINSTVNTVAESASLVTTVFNKTGSPIPKMSAVYINGGQGDQPTVALAIATGDPTSAGTYGLTFENIPDMSTGKVVVFGALTGLDTDQFNPTSPHGDVNGQVLYLSPNVSGALTLTKPSAPNHIVALGTIVRTHQNQGIIEVRVQNGFELEELHNVAISGVTNGQFLQYNSASGLWVASSLNNTVSGLLPTISNSGDNRLLTSTGSTIGINAESNLTFNGSVLNVIGSGIFSNGILASGFNARIGYGSADDSQYFSIEDGLAFIKNGDGTAMISCEELTLYANDNLPSIRWNDRVLYDNLGNPTLYWSEPQKIGVFNGAPQYNLDVAGTGNFSSGLYVNNTAVSVSGHTHSGDDISFRAYGSSFNAVASGNIANFLWGLVEGDAGHLAGYLTPSLDNVYAFVDHNHISLDITDFNSSVSGLLTKTIAAFTATNNQPPASGYATIDTRNSIPVLEFDATTDESAVFCGVIPHNAVLTSGLLVRLMWMADTATSGDVRWGVQWEGDGTDLDSDSFDTATLATSTANATNGIESVAEITCTSINGLTAGDRYRLKIYRDADDGVNDTMNGDAQLVFTEVRIV